MTKKIFLLISLVSLFGFSMASLEATSFDVRFIGVDYGLAVTRTIVNAGSTVGTTAGLFHFLTSSNQHLYTFCIEPLQFTSYDLKTYNTAPLQSGPTNMPGGMGLTKADNLMELYGRYAPAAFPFAGSSSFSLLQAQALQLATWEIVRETNLGYNVLGGNIYFASTTSTASALGVAQEYLDSLDGTGPRMALQAALNNDHQDFTVTPEPASILLLGSGLISLAGMVGWRNRRK